MANKATLSILSELLNKKLVNKILSKWGDNGIKMKYYLGNFQKTK